MSDDFFEGIDKSLSEQNASEDRAERRRQETLGFAKEVVERVKPVAEEYQRKLKERGINARVEQHTYSLLFAMKYQDGGVHELMLGLDRLQQSISFSWVISNDDNRKSNGEDGTAYDRDSWKDELYEIKLKKVITDYVFYAPRHRGVA